MTKQSEEGLSIKDMDFGDFINPEDDFLTPPIPKKEGEEEVKEKEVEEPEEEIDLNAALSEKIESEESEEDVKKDKDGVEPPVPTDDEPFTLVLARYQLEQGVLSSLDEEKLQEVIKKDGEVLL